MRSQIQTPAVPPRPKSLDRPFADLGTVGLLTVVVLIWPLALVLGAWQAFVVWKLYGWFVQPLDDVFPVLMFWQVFGLLLFVDTFRRPPRTDRSDLSGTVARTFGYAIMLGLPLATGWLVVEFML